MSMVTSSAGPGTLSVLQFAGVSQLLSWPPPVQVTAESSVLGSIHSIRGRHDFDRFGLRFDCDGNGSANMAMTSKTASTRRCDAIRCDSGDAAAHSRRPRLRQRAGQGLCHKRETRCAEDPVLVPTVRVEMPSSALSVVGGRPRTRERPRRHSHAGAWERDLCVVPFFFSVIASLPGAARSSGSQTGRGTGCRWGPGARSGRP